MRPKVSLCLALLICAAQAPAATERPIRDRSEFQSAVAGRELTAFTVALTLTLDGGIEGRAFGKPVVGSWTWREGYFCRVMTVGARLFPENCQTVSVEGKRITFTADRGTGQTARMTLR
jgi:hypothetical protein